MGEKLSILHCLRAPVGGLFRHVLDLAREQSKLGHEVGLIADSTSGDRLTQDHFAAIHPHLKLGLHRIEMSRKPGIGDVAAALATCRIATDARAQILHGHGAKGGAFARLASARMKLVGSQSPKCFYTPHGGTLHFSPRSVEGIFYFSAERLLARATDGIIFESAFSQRTFVEKIGLHGRPSRVIHNGLAADDFQSVQPQNEAADVLYVGELRQLKGVDVLLEALVTLSGSQPVRAVIVGGGPDAEEFKALAEQLGLGGRVTFPGPMPARSAFALGRTIVVPSRAESFPYIVLEAAAAGIPLIATNVGGIPEITRGTQTELIPPGDIGALKSALAAAITNPAGAKQRAAELRARVQERFTVERMTRDVLDFYVNQSDTH